MSCVVEVDRVGVLPLLESKSEYKLASPIDGSDDEAAGIGAEELSAAPPGSPPGLHSTHRCIINF